MGGFVSCVRSFQMPCDAGVHASCGTFAYCSCKPAVLLVGSRQATQVYNLVSRRTPRSGSA